MTHFIELDYAKEVFEIEFSNQRAGYGQWNIIAEVNLHGMVRTSKIHFTDASWIDELNDLETSQEKQQFYFDRFYDEFEDVILEWVLEDYIFVDLTKCDKKELETLEDFTGIEMDTLLHAQAGKGTTELVLFENGEYSISEKCEDCGMTEVDADAFIKQFKNRK